MFLVATLALQASATTHLDGKTIGLDAGHGGGATGAIGKCEGVSVIEADVNLAVRAELAALIDVGGGTPYLIDQLSTRKARVADAEAGGSDILISIHHNGSTNLTADYTQSFVTQKKDKELAKPIHAKLLAALNTDDKGIKNDGYGMTVYGSLPGVLTESYFITNTENACDFIDYQNGVSGTRVELEAQALYDGLVDYYSTAPDGGGGGKPTKCSPWPSCKNQ